MERIDGGADHLSMASRAQRPLFKWNPGASFHTKFGGPMDIGLGRLELEGHLEFPVLGA